MKTRTARFIPLAVAAVLSGCSDSTGLDPDDLAGTWNATVALAINPANTAQTADLIALGLTISMEIRDDTSVTATFDYGTVVDVETGTLTVVDGQARLRLEGSLSVGTIARDGDQMTLILTNGVEWDFDDDGVDAPATIHFELLRVG